LIYCIEIARMIFFVYLKKRMISVLQHPLFSIE
jgi:hypothetical protein